LAGDEKSELWKTAPCNAGDRLQAIRARVQNQFSPLTRRLRQGAREVGSQHMVSFFIHGGTVKHACHWSKTYQSARGIWAVDAEGCSAFLRLGTQRLLVGPPPRETADQFPGFAVNVLLEIG
jgi:hypothetical protein